MNRLLKLTGFFMMTLVIFSACNRDKKEAEENYRTLSAINDSLYYYGEAWTDHLPDAVNHKDFTTLGTLRQEAEAFVDRKLEYVRNMEEDANVTPLKKAEINYLLLEKEIIHEGFGRFEMFSDTTSNEEISDAYAGLLAMIEQEEEEQQRLRTAFKQYAEEYNIKTDKE